MLQFDATNVFKEYREHHWNELWPVAKDAAPNAGFRDYGVADYIPYAEVFNNSLEYSLDYQMSALPMRLFINHVWVIIGLYLVCVFGGKRLMRDRKPFDLKVSLACWNLFLAVFSILGSLRVVPHLAYLTYANGPLYFLCRAVSRSFSDPPVFFWVTLFIYSKYFELIDTAFLVLRKKPISFLHWFHHATVTVYCWYSFANQLSTGIWFAGMNFLVHAIMYFYYFLAAIREPPNWGFAVTTLQLAQMVVGMVVNIAHVYYAVHVPNCDISYPMVYAAFIMYACYAALFAHFFVERYLRKKRQRNAKANGNGHAQPSNGHTNGTQKKRD